MKKCRYMQSVGVEFINFTIRNVRHYKLRDSPDHNTKCYFFNTFKFKVLELIFKYKSHLELNWVDYDQSNCFKLDRKSQFRDF